ncbi:L,D-transpeptidase [Microvirga antarctica]|uniref:L,D-transpeptidase n=1 Tax=Microvirga antarctica TaxID=2819233 RepID=UPI001B30A2FA|nr:L,D-transpeptidase [Microvirga antarctica]
MGRTRAALTGLACAFVALATPAAAFTAIDPLTRQPLYSAEQAVKAQASPIPREIVSYDGRQAPGTIVVSTSERRLYYVLGDGKAVRYGVGVGRPGFQWGGAHAVTMKREWPDWRPPAAMLKRRPDLPRHMAGGPDNPLGARALYIGSTIYRIHGSNEPETIGEAVSSGCIRMTNEDVTDLYTRAKVGARVVVQR